MVDQLKGYFTDHKALPKFIGFDSDLEKFLWLPRKAEDIVLLPNMFSKMQVAAGGSTATPEAVALMCQDLCNRWNVGHNVGKQIRWYKTPEGRKLPSRTYAILDDSVVTADTFAAAFKLMPDYINRIANANPKLTKGQKMAYKTHRNAQKLAKSARNKARWAECRDNAKKISFRVLTDRGFTPRTSPERWKFIEDSVFNFLWQNFTAAEAKKAAEMLLDGPDPETKIISVSPTGAAT